MPSNQTPVSVMTNEDVQALDGTDMAYVPVLEGVEQGRDEPGWYMGVAVRNHAGYHQLRPGYGPYEKYDDAHAFADDLNEKLGHPNRMSAFRVVLSSLGAQEAELRTERAQSKGRRT